MQRSVDCSRIEDGSECNGASLCANSNSRDRLSSCIFIDQTSTDDDTVYALRGIQCMENGLDMRSLHVKSLYSFIYGNKSIPCGQ